MTESTVETRLRPRRLALIAGVALAARVGYVLAFMRGYTPNSDADSYFNIGRAVSEGHGYVFTLPFEFVHATAIRPPLYPTLIAGAFEVFGVHVGVAQGVNIVAGTLVAVAGAMIGARIAGPRAGLGAGLVVALYPPLVANDVTVLVESIAVLLLFAIVLLLLDGRTVLGRGRPRVADARPGERAVVRPRPRRVGGVALRLAPRAAHGGSCCRRRGPVGRPQRGQRWRPRSRRHQRLQPQRDLLQRSAAGGQLRRCVLRPALRRDARASARRDRPRRRAAEACARRSPIPSRPAVPGRAVEPGALAGAPPLEQSPRRDARRPEPRRAGLDAAALLRRDRGGDRRARARAQEPGARSSSSWPRRTSRSSVW